jgi:hypothetical protein
MSDILDQETPHEDVLYELYFADGSVEKDEGLIWKEVLREGVWKYRPGAGAKPIPIPLKVVAGNTDEEGQIGMADLIDAFEDGAVDHVTVPTSHEDKPQDNTGYVRKLKVVGKNGKKKLLAGIEFTEPDIEEKAQRGSIAGSSCGIMFDYVRKDSGKKYGKVIGHVALTNKPWINGMKPFGVDAAEFSQDDIVSLLFEEVVWDKDKSYNGLRQKLDGALAGTGFFCVDIQDNKALVNKFDNGASKDVNYVIPFDFNENEIVLPAQDKWIEASQEWVKASEDTIKTLTQRFKKTSESEELSEEAPDRGATHSDPENNGGNMSGEDKKEKKEDTGAPSDEPAPAVDLSEEAKQALLDQAKKDWEESNLKLAEENETLRKSVHRMQVDQRIGELEKVGFKNYPGLLAQIRTAMLADTGKPVLTLSEQEEGKEPVEVSLAVTDVIERFIEALPYEDGRLNFGEQALEVEDVDVPPSFPEGKQSDLSEEERIDAFAEALGKTELVKNTKKDGDE